MKITSRINYVDKMYYMVYNTWENMHLKTFQIDVYSYYF